MDDGIIKGTGNSRYLKSIPGFLAQYPTYEDFAEALTAGTLPIDLNGINETGWEKLGTALNKANLLSDDTAALYGLGADATVDAVLKSTALPPGAIFWYASETIPTGFLLCDGSNISRADYAKLFAVIGTTFGTGDGSTTFTLPDLRAAFVRGAGTKGNYKAPFGKTQTASAFRAVYFPTNVEQSRYGMTMQEPIQNADATYISGKVSTFSIFGSAGRQGEYYALFSIRPYNIALTPIIKY